MKPRKLKLRQWKNSPWIRMVLMLAATIVTSILLLACCMFYTTGTFRSSFHKFVRNVTESGILMMIRSESNVLCYVNDTQNQVEGGLITQALSQRIPLHKYITRADDLDFNQYVQEAKAAINKEQITQLAKNDTNDFLYYNGNVFSEANSEGISQTAETEPELEDSTWDQDVNMIVGETYMEDESAKAVNAPALSTKKEFYTLEQLSDFDFFVKNCYVLDATVATEELFNAKKLLSRDLTLDLDSSKPQVLIYHTHSQETFYDSRKGAVEDSIVGVGEVLADILEEKYGINVIHDTSTYDLSDGELSRNIAYTVALPSLEKILQYNPSIQVMVDLHRDGLPAGMDPEAGKRLAVIDGEDCAQIMLFNGLSRNVNGPIDYLPNPNQQSNLAFSLQLFLEGKGRYPDLMRPIFLKQYRFNLHLIPRSTLVELGTQYNTVQEAKNSMKYLAEILVNVLKGDKTP